MRVFMVDMHSRVPKSFAKAFEKYDITLCMAGKGFDNEPVAKIKYGRKWDEETINEKGLTNVEIVEPRDLFENPPDIYMIMSFEQCYDQLQVYNMLANQGTPPKLVFYSGNNNTPYPMNYVDNIISADTFTTLRMMQAGKNVLEYYPHVDFENEFSYHGPSSKEEDVIRSYIYHHQNYFPNSYAFMTQCINETSDLIKYDIGEKDPQAVGKYMRNSMGTIHFKDAEGYGYSILESMGTGRLVFVWQNAIRGKSCEKWCIDGVTSFNITSVEQYREIVTHLKSDYEARNRLEEKCASTIREIINNEEQSERLANYLQNLI